MPQAKWDDFHAERLEAERGLTSVQVRQALARGDLREDDLIRPAGSSQPWVALADCPEIHQTESPEPGPTPELPASSVIAVASTPEVEPKTEGLSKPLSDMVDEPDTEMLNASDEFATGAEAEEKSDEVDGADQTRFFHGMVEDEYDLLGDADHSVAFPRGTNFGFGPSEDQLDAMDEDYSRPDGKVADPLNYDPRLELNARNLGPSRQDQKEEEELETWDDGEPSSRVNAGPKQNDDEDELQFIDHDSSEAFADEDVVVLELSSDVEEPTFDTGEEDELGEEFDPIEEEEAAAEFTLARGSAETVEELDLAAMVDVAFQLVLFFLVTATTVLYKSLEVPKPNPESSPAASATQGKSLDELKNDFILVEIDPAGRLKIDQEAIDASHDLLVKRLRSAREETGRQSMLLSADFTTPHRSAVLAYDAANEIGLGIAIARPTPKP